MSKYAYALVYDRDVAEDIVFNAFRELSHEKPSITSPNDISNFLIDSTSASVYGHNIKDYSRTDLLMEFHNKETSHLNLTEIKKAVIKSSKKLPYRLKKVVELTMADLTTEEIAAEMHISESNIAVLKSQAVKLLRKDLNIQKTFPDYDSPKQPENREQILKIKDEINEEFIKYYTKHPHKLYDISPRQYEKFVAELLKDMGYEVWLNNHTRDGGRDIIAVLNTPSNDKIVTIVECKKYKLDNPVPIEIVERFMYTIREKDKANAGWIVTTSTFSREAQKCQHIYKWILSLKDNKDLAFLCSNYGKWKTSGTSGLWLPDNPLL